MKKIVYVLGAIIVLVVAVAIYVFVFAGDLIKTAVERVGSDATQAEVTLSKVDLDMFQGTGGMQGLIVGNPKGFKTPSAFELGEISLQIDKETVGQNPVVIKSIAITGPIVTYEKGDSTSNVDAIKGLANLTSLDFHYCTSLPDEAAEDRSTDQEHLLRPLQVVMASPLTQPSSLRRRELPVSVSGRRRWPVERRQRLLPSHRWGVGRLLSVAGLRLLRWLGIRREEKGWWLPIFCDLRYEWCCLWRRRQSPW